MPSAKLVDEAEANAHEIDLAKNCHGRDQIYGDLWTVRSHVQDEGQTKAIFITEESE